MKSPVTNIIFGTMTLGYHGYGARVHDLATAGAMLETYAGFGHDQLDTASPYGDGSNATMLADLQAPSRFRIATRFAPVGVPQGHEPGPLRQAVETNFAGLKLQRANILYLSARDTQTPIERTLGGAQELYEEGLFDELGLSNVSAAEVEEYVAIADRHGWVRPSVYQGPYNAVARSIEAELLPTLRHSGIRFHAFNPLAGGAFAPSFGDEQSVEAGSRFDDSHRQGQSYRQRYWSDAYLAAMRTLREKCRQAEVSPIDAALRWLVHHSALEGDHGDGIILGASSVRHLQANLESVHSGLLPEALVGAMDEAGEATRASWPGFAISI